MTTKSIQWAYPTSPNAKRLGFSHRGCWTVQVVNNFKGKAVAGFATLQEAERFASTLPQPWDKYTYKPSPQELQHAQVCDKYDFVN